MTPRDDDVIAVSDRVDVAEEMTAAIAKIQVLVMESPLLQEFPDDVASGPLQG